MSSPWDSLVGLCPEFCSRDRQQTRSLDSPSKARGYQFVREDDQQALMRYGAALSQVDSFTLPTAMSVSRHQSGANTESLQIWSNQDLRSSLRPASGDCGICCQEGRQDLVSANRCNHLICTECLFQNSKAQLDLGRVPVCHERGCGAKISPGIMKQICAHYPNVWTLFKTISLREEKRYHECPGCQQKVFLTAEGSEQLSLNRTPGRLAATPGLCSAIRCPKCTMSFCMICLDQCHPRMTCEENQRRRQPYGPAGIFEGTKCCPRCGDGIEKDIEDEKKSCDHMTCARCRKQFCWLCLSDHLIVKAHGNHFHQRFCDHWRSYNGPDKLERDCPECLRTGKVCRPPK